MSGLRSLWTKDRCIEALRSVAVDGVVLWADANRFHPSLPTMAARQWGSFTLACQAIGLNGKAASRPRYETCTIEGCDTPTRSPTSPLCDTHYCRQWRRRHGQGPVKAKATLEHSHGYLIDLARSHPLVTPGYKDRVYQHRRVFYDAHGEGPFACHVCGSQVTWADMHVDHLDDDRKNNELSNLAAACPTCNQKRGHHKMAATARASGYQLTAFGKTQCLTEWSRDIGISPQSLRSRLAKGWPLDRALSEGRGKTGPKARSAD